MFSGWLPMGRHRDGAHGRSGSPAGDEVQVLAPFLESVVIPSEARNLGSCFVLELRRFFASLTMTCALLASSFEPLTLHDFPADCLRGEECRARRSRCRFPRPAPPQVPLLGPPPLIGHRRGRLSHLPPLCRGPALRRHQPPPGAQFDLVGDQQGLQGLEHRFLNATCIAALLDRLAHHAGITLIEGTSYRVQESELEAATRKKKPERSPQARRP